MCECGVMLERCPCHDGGGNVVETLKHPQSGCPDKRPWDASTGRIIESAMPIECATEEIDPHAVRHSLNLSDYHVANLRAAIEAGGYPGPPLATDYSYPLATDNPLTALNTGDWFGEIYNALPVVTHPPNRTAAEIAKNAQTISVRYPRSTSAPTPESVPTPTISTMKKGEKFKEFAETSRPPSGMLAWSSFPSSELEELEQFEREATPGPWKSDRDVVRDSTGCGPYVVVARRTHAYEDARFIASFRNAAPYLFPELRELRVQVTKLIQERNEAEAGEKQARESVKMWRGLLDEYKKEAASIAGPEMNMLKAIEAVFGARANADRYKEDRAHAERETKVAQAAALQLTIEIDTLKDSLKDAVKMLRRAGRHVPTDDDLHDQVDDLITNLTTLIKIQ